MSFQMLVRSTILLLSDDGEPMRFEYRFGPDPNGIFHGRPEARAIERKSNEVIAAIDQRGS